MATTKIRVFEFDSINGGQVDNSSQVFQERLARHKRRIRIPRGIQHLLTALVSLAVGALQGRTYIIYQKSKHVAGAWPSFPDLLPIYLLFSTAVAATVMDLAALASYTWPQTKGGRMAFKLASGSRSVITTTKTLSYTYSYVVGRVTCNQNISSKQYNDLWSWSCGPKSDAMSSVNQAPSNCTTSIISSYLSIASICVEVLGVIIDSFVKMDEARWKKKIRAADEHSDSRPLLASPGYLEGSGGKATKQKYSMVTDDQYDKMDKYQSQADKYLRTQMGKMDKMDGEQSASFE